MRVANRIKKFAGILALVVPVLGSAGEAQAFPISKLKPQDFTYTQESARPPKRGDAVLDLAKLDIALAGLQLTPADPRHIGWIPILNVTQVYSESLSGRAIFIRVGFEPTRADVFENIVEHPRGLLFHAKARDGKPYAALVSGFGKAEGQKALEVIYRILSKGETTWRVPRLIESARAEAPGASCQFPPEVPMPVGGIAAVVDHAEDATYWDMTQGCVMGALQGAWDATGGLVVSAYNAVTDPYAAWDSVTETWDTMMKFATDFQNQASQMVEGFSSMPSDAQAEIFCAFVGGIGVDVLIAVATGGVGAAKFAATTTKFLSKIGILARFAKQLGRLKKLANVADLKSFRYALYQKIAAGMPDEMVETIAKLADHDLPELAYGAASCAISD